MASRLQDGLMASRLQDGLMACFSLILMPILDDVGSCTLSGRVLQDPYLATQELRLQVPRNRDPVYTLF